MGHARALINVDTVDKQLYVFNEIKNKGLSVRQTEELVRKLYKRHAPVKNSVKPTLPAAFKKIEDNLASHFSTRVKLNHSKKGHGSISIEYYSLQELNKITGSIGCSGQLSIAHEDGKVFYLVIGLAMLQMAARAQQTDSAACKKDSASIAKKKSDS